MAKKKIDWNALKSLATGPVGTAVRGAFNKMRTNKQETGRIFRGRFRNLKEKVAAGGIGSLLKPSEVRHYMDKAIDLNDQLKDIDIPQSGSKDNFLSKPLYEGNGLNVKGIHLIIAAVAIWIIKPKMFKTKRFS
jgi:hypothetical protein